MRQIAGMCALAAATAACGYGLVSTQRLGGQETISVATFAELEPVGVAPELTRYFAELASQGGVVVLASGAGAELRGLVKGARTSAMPIADPRPGAAISGYQVSIDVEASLVDRQGHVVWSSALSVSEDFLPSFTSPQSTAVLETEAARRRALDRLAQRAARELYERLVMSGG